MFTTLDTARSRVILVGLLAAVTASTACGRSPAPDLFERAIRDTYEPQLGGPLDAVRCPPGEAAPDAGPVACRVRALGIDFVVHATRTPAGIHMELDGIVIADQVAANFHSKVKQPDGSPATLDCANAPRAVAARAGAVLACRTTMAGRPYVVEIRVTGSDGHYGWDILDPAPPARVAGAGCSVPVPPGWQPAEWGPPPGAPAGTIQLRAQRQSRETGGDYSNINVMPMALSEPLPGADPEVCAALAASVPAQMGRDVVVEQAAVVEGPFGPACQLDVVNAAQGQRARQVFLADGLNAWGVTCMSFGGDTPPPVDACSAVVGGWRRE